MSASAPKVILRQTNTHLRNTLRVNYNSLNVFKENSMRGVEDLGQVFPDMGQYRLVKKVESYVIKPLLTLNSPAVDCEIVIV